MNVCKRFLQSPFKIYTVTRKVICASHRWVYSAELTKNHTIYCLLTRCERMKVWSSCRAHNSTYKSQNIEYSIK